MAVQRARQMIMSCHAALLVFDAKEGLVCVPIQRHSTATAMPHSL